jgi:hypothetical protein
LLKVDSQMPKFLHQMHFSPEKYPGISLYSLYCIPMKQNIPDYDSNFLNWGPIPMAMTKNHLQLNRPLCVWNMRPTIGAEFCVDTA